MRFGFARLWLAVAVATAGVAVVQGAPVVAHAQSASPVIIRSGDHNGYGRIVFQWDRKVDYTAQIVGNQLVVHFNDPLVSSMRGVVPPVSKYVSDAFFDPDGHSVAFVLRDNFEVRTFNVGTNVVLDILDKQDTPKPAPAAPTPSTPSVKPAPSASSAGQGNAGSNNAAGGLPTPVTKPAPPQSGLTSGTMATADSQNVPALDVRVGRHPTFYRLVFDWPSRVNYTVKGADGNQTVQFNAPARINAADLTRRLPRGVTVSQDGVSPLAVTIRTNPAHATRHFKSGNKVVVDVMVKGEPAGDQAASPPAASQPAPVQKTATNKPATAKAPDAPRPLAPPKGTTAAATKGAQATGPNEKATAGPRKSIGTLKVSVDQSTDQLKLGFPFGQPTAAAIWSRAGFLWMAFDTPADLDLSRVRQEASQVIGVAEQVPSPYATLLRMTIPEGVGLYSKQDGKGNWDVILQKGDLQPIEKLGPTIELDDQTRARLVVPLDRISATIPVDDPEVGDTLRVVPTEQAGYGIETPLQYPEFDVLPSIQGVVIAPVNNSVQVSERSRLQGENAPKDSTTGDAVVVTSEDGLNISPEGAKLLASATGVRSRIGQGGDGLIFDLKDWRKGGLDNYNNALHQLLRELVNSGDEHRNKARLDLARYYMANGLGPEANALIEMMEQDDPLIAQKSEFRALKGAVKFLNGQYNEAERMFSDPRLKDIPEIKLWRAVNDAARGLPEEGAQDLASSIHILDNYPPELLMRLGPIAAEQALIVKNPKAGSKLLDKMASTPEASPTKLLDVQYLQGLYDQEAGNLDQAIATWDDVAKGNNRKARAHAIFDRTELLLKLNRLTPADAINQFEKLRFAWRGDNFELAVLRRLAELQIQDKRYRDGLHTLRQAAIFFPNDPETPAVTAKMHKTFEDLFLGPEAKNISAIKAVALYDEFRELTPAGQAGDELIRNLADRMVKVELFGRAEQLLQHQIDFRLTGIEKSKVGARLALVYLLDGKPDETIKVLDSTKGPEMGADLTLQRNHIRARALLDTNKGAEAMSLLDGDFSHEAELLRIEYYRKSKDYLSAADTFQRLVGPDEGKLVENFSNERKQYVLNWAVNLAMAGRERELNMLKRRYGNVMADSPFAVAFNLITSPPTRGLINYSSIKDQVKEAEQFKDFLSNYRDQLAKNNLSGIN
jgi:tetratricopeptide (TPR) repeat protein